MKPRFMEDYTSGNNNRHELMIDGMSIIDKDKITKDNIKLLKELISRGYILNIYIEPTEDTEEASKKSKAVGSMEKLIEDAYDEAELMSIKITDKFNSALTFLSKNALGHHRGLNSDIVDSFSKYKESEKVVENEEGNDRSYSEKMYKTLLVNSMMKDADKDNISDGHHTFDELYHQRTILLSLAINALALTSTGGLMYEDVKDLKMWKSILHHDGSSFNNHSFLVSVQFSDNGITKQFSFHCHTKYWESLAIPGYERSPIEYDGHTVAESMKNIELLSRTLYRLLEDVNNNASSNTAIRDGFNSPDAFILKAHGIVGDGEEDD